MVAGEALGGRGECRVWRASGYLACWGLCFRVGVMKIGMLVLFFGFGGAGLVGGAERILVWPDLAPGETSSAMGTTLAYREQDVPPITRVEKIRRPSLEVFLPPKDKANGTAILVVPGGGFGKVVPDMEGSEAAPWLAELGIATIVLSYRTNEVTPKDEPAWRRPLEDAQRSLRLIRANAEAWNLKKDRIGMLAFSAGGQVGAILHAMEGKAIYAALDAIDEESCASDFSMLVYPWKVTDKAGELLPEIAYSKQSEPAFIVHTHDDASTSMGSVLIYAELKKHGVPAELHVYENGGHGYGMRARPNSNIGTWPARAVEWLVLRGLGAK